MGNLPVLLGLLWAVLAGTVSAQNYFEHGEFIRQTLNGLSQSLAEDGRSLKTEESLRLRSIQPWLLKLGNIRSHVEELVRDGETMEEMKEALLNVEPQCMGDVLFFLADLLDYVNATGTSCSVNGSADCGCVGKRASRLAADNWVLRVLDSFGKVPAGFLSGDTFWLGDFQECRKLRAKGAGAGVFNGQYCSLQLPVDFDLTGNLEGPKSCNANQGNLQKGRKLAQTSILRYGICVPDSCSSTDISNVIQSIGDILLNQTHLGREFLNKTNGAIPIGVVCHTPAEEMLKNDGFAIAMMIILGVFALLMVMGTAYEFLDYGPRANLYPIKAGDGQMSRADFHNQISGFQKALLAFSVVGNGSKLLSMEAKSGQLDCIHGIRFISMTWVMLGHTYYFAAPYVSNLLDFIEILKEFSSQAVLNATVSVDSFFVISGLLMTYLFLSMTEKRKGRNLRSPYHWIMYYVHRYIRLTPVYGLVMGLDIGLFKYLTDGPIWRQAGVEKNACANSWFYNLLYVNNFFGTEEMCMGHSWYLSIDMQIYWVAPPILVLFYYFAPAAIAILSILIATHFSLSAYMEWLWNFPPNAAWTLAPQQFNPDPLVGLWYFKYDYIPTYTRCGTYCIGMIFGYCLYRIEKKRGSLKYPIHKGINIFLWLFMAACASWVLYGLWPISRGDISSEGFNIFYAASNRLLWGLAVGWVVFACVTGNGGLVNSFLSSPMLFPFSRLTYCAYLIHPFVMYYIYQGAGLPVHYDSHYTFVYYFFAHFTVSYALAFILSLAFESPILTLEKLLLPRESGPAKTKPAQVPLAPSTAFEKESPIPSEPAEKLISGSASSSSSSQPSTLGSLPRTSPWNAIAFPNNKRDSVASYAESDEIALQPIVYQTRGEEQAIPQQRF